LKRCKLTDL